jgi:hypothetical protein
VPERRPVGGTRHRVVADAASNRHLEDEAALAGAKRLNDQHDLTVFERTCQVDHLAAAVPDFLAVRVNLDP